MKRALKIIIPLLLVVALLATAVWFFIFRRPDTTNAFLLGQARYMTDRGRYPRAIKYYSWAASLEPERSDIYVELAETYAASGNYTKAEYTLVKAISAHADMTELYAALCRVYVAQGKFLDATQMLDRLTDPTVKAELDAMRPDAPTVEPSGGYFSEYISVSVNADSNSIPAPAKNAGLKAIHEQICDTAKNGAAKRRWNISFPSNIILVVSGRVFNNHHSFPSRDIDMLAALHIVIIAAAITGIAAFIFIGNCT